MKADYYLAKLRAAENEDVLYRLVSHMMKQIEQADHTMLITAADIRQGELIDHAMEKQGDKYEHKKVLTQTLAVAVACKLFNK